MEMLFKIIKLITHADDIVLLSETEMDFQSMAEAIDESKQMGFSVHIC